MGDALSFFDPPMIPCALKESLVVKEGPIYKSGALLIPGYVTVEALNNLHSFYLQYSINSYLLLLQSNSTAEHQIFRLWNLIHRTGPDPLQLHSGFHANSPQTPPVTSLDT